MATWIMHLRICDNLIKHFNIKEKEAFIVGNIGPDCGEMIEKGVFDPPGNITHFRLNYPKDKTIHIDVFKEKYLRAYEDKEKEYFYLGYYCHLYIDILFSEKIGKATYLKYVDEFKDKDFIWTVKKDWYDLDKRYIMNNTLESFEIFKNIKSFENKYLDFYKIDSFTKQIKYITAFYEEYKLDINRELIYLTDKEMSDFVKEVTDILIKELKSIIH